MNLSVRKATALLRVDRADYTEHLRGCLTYPISARDQRTGMDLVVAPQVAGLFTDLCNAFKPVGIQISTAFEIRYSSAVMIVQSITWDPHLYGDNMCVKALLLNIETCRADVPFEVEDERIASHVQTIASNPVQDYILVDGVEPLESLP